jgi:hypothetical protein
MVAINDDKLKVKLALKVNHQYFAMVAAIAKSPNILQWW